MTALDTLYHGFIKFSLVFSKSIEFRANLQNNRPKIQKPDDCGAARRLLSRCHPEMLLTGGWQDIGYASGMELPGHAALPERIREAGARILRGAAALLSVPRQDIYGG